MVAELQAKFQKEPVFLSALSLLVFSSILVRPNVRAIDWKVLIILFNLMSVLVALEKYQVMDRISLTLLNSFTTLRSLSLCLVMVTGILAMFVTNDVALLTLAPLTMLIAHRCSFDPVWIIILQTLAANIGSSLTPMGNPQNLFLYEFFQIGTSEFLTILFPFVITGLLLVSLLVPLTTVKDKLTAHSQEVVATVSLRRQLFYLVLFVLVVLSVLRFLDYRIMFVFTILVIAYLDPELFRKIDYYLLGTFIVFFLLVDNLARLPGVTSYIRYLLEFQGHTFLVGVLSSQIISNVPAAILLANFTSNYRELLWGVNVGGMGTLIASLASVISYRIYAKEYPAKKYLINFHLVNIGGATIFTLGALLWLF